MYPWSLTTVVLAYLVFLVPIGMCITDCRALEMQWRPDSLLKLGRLGLQPSLLLTYLTETDNEQTILWKPCWRWSMHHSYGTRRLRRQPVWHWNIPYWRSEKIWRLELEVIKKSASSLCDDWWTIGAAYEDVGLGNRAPSRHFRETQNIEVAAKIRTILLTVYN